MTDDRGEPISLPRRLGHYNSYIMPYFLVIAAVASILLPVDLAEFVTLPALAGMMTFVMFNLFAHVNKMCELCMVMTPLDGDAEAERHSRSLRYLHWTTKPLRIKSFPLPINFILLILGGNVLDLILLNLFDPPYISIRFLDLLTSTLPISYFWISMNRHNRLEPWCPQCKGRGRGRRDQHIKTPDPSPASQ